MAKGVRISQCMIVKNEEKNIEKALSWGKDVVYEQIVVDTGSVDRTVEIAEQMGAKVYHYKWHNDFAAAKNYAIKQATGDWIAFLDADEYFLEQDAREIRTLLGQLSSGKGIPDVVVSPWLQLNDQGEVFSTATQQRVFRNIPWIRYKNPIHEILFRKDRKPLSGFNTGIRFPIYHTGYAPSAFQATQKTTRNKEILLQVLEQNPEDYTNLSYLGDVYFADREYEKAKEVYTRVIAYTGQMLESRRNTAFCTLMRIAANEDQPDMEEEMRSLYGQFEKTGVQCPDMEYWLGIGMIQKQKLRDGVYWLELALKRLEIYRGDDVLFLTGNLEQTYLLLIKAYKELDDLPQVVRYCTILLKANKKQEQAIAPLLELLREDEATDSSQALGFLAKLYDFSDLRDTLFLLKQLRLTPYSELEEALLLTMSSEDRQWLETKRELTWQLPSEVLQERYLLIPIQNQIDYRFLSLMECTGQLSEDELVDRMKGSLSRMKKREEGQYQLYVNCFSTFPIWGELSPERNRYEAFYLRAKGLKQHREDFLWLYSLLGDNRSRQVLYGIVENWMHLEKRVLQMVKEPGLPYFDLDIMPSCTQGIFVDIGTGNGQSVDSFLYCYGEEYRHIYCFEANEVILNALKKKLENIKNLTFQEIPPEKVNADESVSESVDFVKIDVPGSAQISLSGCTEHIQNEHPMIAICTDYQYEDIWKIPRMIAEIDDSYQFYMRYYGENLIPTKFVLYAV